VIVLWFKNTQSGMEDWQKSGSIISATTDNTMGRMGGLEGGGCCVLSAIL